MRDIPCPCCGFLTLEGEYGSYAICPVCDWEDDPVQLANPASAGGANSKSLAEAQVAALIKHPVGVELAGCINIEAWNVGPDIDISDLDIVDEGIPENKIIGNTELEVGIEEAERLIQALQDAINRVKSG